MGATSVYYYDDALFDSDTGRVVSDFTSPGANHSRTALHPLFVLLLNPAGSKIAKIAGSSVVAAVALNSFFGGVAAALAFLFLRRAGVGGPFAALYGGLTGFSAAHLVFGAVPETWIFAACGIIVLYFLAAEPHDWPRALGARWALLRKREQARALVRALAAGAQAAYENAAFVVVKLP